MSFSLHIVLDSAAEPITGSLTCDGAARQQFTGWLELASLLADAINTTHPPRAGALDDPPAAPERPGRGATRFRAG
jgi:hypothetical protein